MSDREFPFEDEAICGGCGANGAFDIYGDMVCSKCLEADACSPRQMRYL